MSTINNSAEIDSYIPSEEQTKQLVTLHELVEKCKQEKVDICVAGGYGLDALYGKLTRDHEDIDLLVEDSKLQKLRNILEEMGFIEDLSDSDKNKNLYRPGYESDLPGKFKIEFGTINDYNEYFPEEVPLKSVIPEVENGSLAGFSFKTLTLKGQEMAAEVQNKRAAQGRWGDYKYKEHFDTLINRLHQTESSDSI